MKYLMLIIIIFGFLHISAQDRILVDCIHGADFWGQAVSGGGYDTYFFPINFSAVFPDYEVTSITADNLPITNVLIFEDIPAGNESAAYELDLPEQSDEIISFYVVITRTNGDTLYNPLGTISNPDGDIVDELYQGIGHCDNAYGAGWDLDLILDPDHGHTVYAGYGPPLFSTNEYPGAYDLNDFDVMIKIKDYVLYALLGGPHEYSEHDLLALEEAFSQGLGFMNFYNFYCAAVEKPFVHFDTNTKRNIDYQIKISGQYTYTKPVPAYEDKCLTWENFSLDPELDNEIVYEFISGERLNFLWFSINGETINVKNNIPYNLEELTIFKHIAPGKFKYAQIGQFDPLESVSTSKWKTIHTKTLIKILKQQLLKDAMEYGLEPDEAHHLFNDFLWVESLIHRAYDSPDHYFGIYHFGKEVYDRFIPCKITPEPEEMSRNMWVMVSNIQNRPEEPAFILSQPDISYQDPQDFEMREYGVIDEYYSFTDRSREDQFFGIELNTMFEWVDPVIYDSDLAYEITENILLSELSIWGQWFNFITDNPMDQGIFRNGTASTFPIVLGKTLFLQGRLITFGSSMFFLNFYGDYPANWQFLNECVSAILTSENFPTIADDDFLPDNLNDIKLCSYPNPFNPETVISFQLPADSDQQDVELVIYNLKGQKVKNLPVILSLSKEKGMHTIVWDGTDDSNNPVSSGIYFYKLKAGDQQLTRKMIMIK
jgi:flagellar hook capping protein FlgD